MPTVEPKQLAREKIAAARIWLLRERPFFGVLARYLVVEPSERTEAFRLLPDDRLLVRAEPVANLPFAYLCGRLAHLTLHAALRAIRRAAGRDGARWNRAHDLAIDPLVRAASLEDLPIDRPPGVTEGMAAETVFELLDARAAPPTGQWDLADPPGLPPPSIAPPPLGGGGSDGEDSDEDATTLPLPGLPSFDSITASDERDVQWKLRLAEAIQADVDAGGKTWGQLPAWGKEWIRATIEPPPRWEAVLQGAMAGIVRTRRTFLRPSRRLAAVHAMLELGPDDAWVVTMPGRKVEPVGRLAAVLDTSGSVPASALARALGGIAAAASAEGLDEVRLVQCDATITKDSVVSPAELVLERFEIVGRGGTDFRSPLTKLASDARREGARFTVVYVTDLDGPFPAASEVSSLDVLWVVVAPPAKPPPFGRVVELA
ncbi:MAG: hypothetical protein IT379_26000 [Deltaproteobacteria bacterium]|nr:hypothetical protein [Deltaproteobacteria bacterium]